MLEYKPHGLADPDYARIFTQARVIAWQFGFALLGHGSFTRDLDLLMVPWEDRASDGVVPAIMNRIAQVTGTAVKGEPRDKPHGRKAYTLCLPDGVRWVDFSVMPATGHRSADTERHGSNEHDSGGVVLPSQSVRIGGEGEKE